MNQLRTAINRIKVVVFLLFISFFAKAQSNYAVSFDGVDDYVSLPSSVAVSQSNTFTIEAWVYWNGGGNACIYSETVQGNDNPMFSISPRSGDGGGIELVLRDNATTGLVLQPATATITANRWVHVAIVRSSATNIKTYIDGMLKDDASFTAPAAWTPDKVNIGIRWRASQDGPFGGKIDEVRIWNTARTQEEIKANMFNKNLADNAAGLVAYYRMNDGSGTTATNSCTNTSSINGTLTNGPTWVASPVQFGGNALSFDGVDDYVVSTSTFNLNMNNSSFTVEAWINSANSSANTTTERILMQWGPTWQAGGYQLVCTNSYINFNFNGSSTGSCTYSVNWQDGNWHHVAGVFDLSSHTLYLYYDGVQRAAVSTGSNAPGALNTSLYIGGSPSVSNSFVSAKMDEVRVWNFARTQADIQANMNKELDHPFNASGTVPRLYYTFNQGNMGGDNTGLTTVTEQYLQAHGNGSLVNFALSGSSSNFVAQNSNVFILPLKWLSFTARRQNNGVLLQWSTASEMNTSEFVIEHQQENGSWKSIGSVPAGSSGEKNNYSYLDMAPANGINNYRVKQRDADGNYSYSEIRMVRINNELRSFEVLSNPVVNKILQLQVNTSKQEVVLHGVDGKIIWRKELPGGMHAINLNNLAKGVYILSDGNSIQKLLVQ